MNKYNIETLFVIWPEAPKRVQNIERALNSCALHSAQKNTASCIDAILRFGYERTAYLLANAIVLKVYERLSHVERDMFMARYKYHQRPEGTAAQLRRYYRHLNKLIDKAVAITDKLGYSDQYYIDNFKETLFYQVNEDLRIRRTKRGNSK